MKVKITFNISDEIDKKTGVQIQKYIPEYVMAWLKGERVKNLKVEKS